MLDVVKHVLEVNDSWSNT